MTRALDTIGFILADDLGITDLGAYGREDHRTPNLDRLAAIRTGRAPARLLRAPSRHWRQSTGAQENTPNPVDAELFNRIYADFDSSLFDPLRADAEAWQSAAVWRQRMNAATRRPPQ